MSLYPFVPETFYYEITLFKSQIKIYMTNYNMSEAAQELNITIGKFTIGRNILFEHLRYLQILQDYPNRNVPHNQFINLGYFQVLYVKSKNRFNSITCVTPLGIKWINEEKRVLIIQNEIKYWEEYYPKDLYLLNVKEAA